MQETLLPSPLRRKTALAWGGSVAAACVVSLVATTWTVPEELNPLLDNVFLGLVSDAIGDDGYAGSKRHRRARALKEGPAQLRDGGEARAKNVMLVVLESTGASRTSVYNPKLTTTPALQALAKRGAVVERAYTSVPHTTKALVSLHCGMYPKFSPGTEEAKFGAIPGACLARLLRDQGFATAYFQTAEEDYERRADLVNEFGFEDFYGKESLDGEGFDEASYFGWEDDVMVEPVLKWIDEHKDQRWYLSMLTLTAHHPYAVPAGWDMRKYAPTKAKNDYLNAVAYVDRTLEKLMAGLDARGVLDDTTLIVVGDHGEGFGEHGRSQHDAVIYEEGIHIPMVVAGAGVAPGSRIQGLRQNIDVLSTFVDVLGLRPMSGRFDGKSLLSDAKGHDSVVVSCHYKNYCMALLEDDDRKTIFHYKHRGPEVFDLAADPGEKRNLLGKGETQRKKVNDAIDLMQSVFARNNKRYRARTKTRVERFVTKEVPDGIAHPMQVRLGDHTELLGVTVDPPVIEAGDQLVFTTYYRVTKKPGHGWRTFHHIRGPQRMRGDHTPIDGAYPVDRWKKGDIIEDRFAISTRPDTLPGTYSVATGMWKKKPKSIRAKAVDVKNGNHHFKDDRVPVPGFRIIRPRVDTARFIHDAMPDVSGLTPVNALLGDSVRLHAVGIDKPRIKGGLKTTLTYVFEVLKPLPPGRFFVDFKGPTKVKRLWHVPVSGTHPPEKWQPGQFIVDHHEIITHTRHRLGDYDVLLGFNGGDGLLPIVADGDAAVVDENRVQVGTYKLTR